MRGLTMRTPRRSPGSPRTRRCGGYSWPARTLLRAEGTKPWSLSWRTVASALARLCASASRM
jgi:hypothetical protein